MEKMEEQGDKFKGARYYDSLKNVIFVQVEGEWIEEHDGRRYRINPIIG